MKQWIQSTFDRQVEDLQTIIRIPSVSRGDAPEDGKPFGKTVHRCLMETLDIARRLGFTKVWDVDGYCGVVEYGEGEESLAVLAHLDVVPEGEGWSVDPYGATILDGRIYGRGTVDDKGAAISALYALAAVKASGKPMRRRVRIVLGCDEERGSLGVEHYLKVEGEPTMAFTPDAEYPVVNSEMGILQTTYQKKMESGVRIAVGSASNVIPGTATAVLPCEAKPVFVPEGFSVTTEGNTVTVTGRGGHASMPELAFNALQALLLVLKEQPLSDADQTVLGALSDLWKMDRHGETLGIDVTDESGRLTFSPDCLTLDETGLTFVTDCRHPFSVTAEKLLGIFDDAYGKLGFVRTDTREAAGHFIPEDSELVSTLMQVYNEIQGGTAKPLSMGGGTYAREMKNAVAFGIVREGAENLCHMPDESISLADMEFNTLVMANAITRLATEDVCR